MTAPDPTPDAPTLPDDLMVGRCLLCGSSRKVTERTQGVWTTCDDCEQQWWCVVTEWDYLDEPTRWGCSGGCEDGWDCHCGDEDDEWDESGAQP